MKDKNQKEKLNLFDIHTHILPNVDDGSTNIEDSLKMLKEEVDNGVSNVVLTPHYRKNMFEVENSEIVKVFDDFQNKVKENNVDVNLYLGREIFINSLTGGYERTLDRIEKGIVSGINNTKNILIEFSYTKEIEISEIVYSLVNKGYQPIIAHIERYVYVHSLEAINDIKQAGALISVNASSVTGLDGLKTKKFVWDLLNYGLVDIISSDIHATRVNNLSKAYELVSKKLGKNIGDELFIINPSKVIN